MSDKAWEQLVDQIETKFGIDKADKTEEPLEDNHQLSRQVEEVIFSRDQSEYKIVRITSPMVIDRKTIYHRTASANRIENVYDSGQTSSKVEFYKRVDDSWQQIEPEQLLN
jgi:hypothetical protein